ncbi:hypothetical protein [Aquibium oceanicum]|uniref:Uncharacterized protein n=1 Tax=Aquibium oceanicum TaxID=1670800 RepID=A0A1L3SU92_9HYPH|nr:hypothetical protein [Aquibium oceanicum]APH72885.1 hypothetical protein BSQ44_17065 [Aquibium oceanicum]
MTDELLTWFFSVITSAGLVGIVTYLARETIARFFSKTVEHHFEKKLEEFKSEIRGKEQELEQIRSFLISSHKERDNALQSKRREAAETLLKIRRALSQFSLLVEYMRILNIENIIRSSDPKIQALFEALTKPFDIESNLRKIGEIDDTNPRLYLSEKSLRAYDAYKTIIVQATMMMKLFSLPLTDKKKLVKDGHLRDMIVKLVPSSKEGFDNFGESFAYEWSQYFYDEILISLRHEISGVDDMSRDTDSAQRLALDSRRALINVQTSIRTAGLSDTLLKSGEISDDSPLKA